MVLSWFNTSEVKVFAGEISREFAKLCKSVELRQDNPAKREARFAKLREKVEAFDRAKKLNVFKRAKLIDELRTGLEAAGVPSEQASDFVSSVLVAPIAKS
jgi:hypothetical protein